jgi:uncharacterized protein (TIGR02231 family)
MPNIATFALSVAATALICASPALAADLALSAKVDAVTVFPDGAMVTRTGEATIAAGEHLLILKGLPAGVDPASVRVEAKATQPLVLGTVETRPAPMAPPSGETVAKLKSLRGEFALAQGRIDAAEAEKRAIERLTLASAESAAKERGLDIDAARKAWTALGEATAAVNMRLVSERAKAVDLESEIKALENLDQRRMSIPTQNRLDLAIAIEALRDLTASIAVTYRVRDARWLPVYDAQLSTSAKPALTLVRRADIIQRTGEDWADAKLTLATQRIARGTAAPELPTQTVNLFDPVAVMPMARAAAEDQRNRDAAQKRESLAVAAPAPAAAPMVAAAPREAEAEVSAFSASWLAPGRVSVTGDGARKSVRLASREIAPELIARVTPAIDPTAYLSASFEHADEAPLLPGEINLTRDGAFIGKGRIGFTPAGDRVELGFGADDRIKVTRAPVRRQDNDPSWASAARRQLSDHKTTIQNLHKEAMKVQVIDRVPVSENSAITVEMLKETTQPTEKQIGDRRGVMGWSFEMKPGESRDIRVAWRMRWPADREIVTGR